MKKLLEVHPAVCPLSQLFNLLQHNGTRRGKGKIVHVLFQMNTSVLTIT